MYKCYGRPNVRSGHDPKFSHRIVWSAVLVLPTSIVVDEMFACGPVADMPPRLGDGIGRYRRRTYFLGRLDRAERYGAKI